MTGPGVDRLAQAQAVIAALFDEGVAVAVTDPQAAQPPPMGDETAHLARAVPKRRREFAAGRAAARAAMIEIGVMPKPVPAGADRAPVWPESVVGSISHTDTLCAAAVTRANPLLGLDIEPDVPLCASLLDAVCTPDERASTQGSDQLALAKLIFSAKEAAFKAQYPVTRQTFGFDHMEVSLDLAERRFAARFVHDVAPFVAGDVLHGRFDRVLDHLVTAVHHSHGMCQGA